MDCNNYLIQGALSCGKTYEAKRLACCAVGLLNKDDKLDENLFKENVGPEKQIEYVPVHEEYEYSSFIQGIEVESENGRMIYRPIDRVFVDICTILFYKFDVCFRCCEPVKGVKGEKETFSFSIPLLSTMTK